MYSWKVLPLVLLAAAAAQADSAREMLAQGARVCGVCGEANITVRGFCSDGCEFVHLSKKVEVEHGFIHKI